MTVETTKWINFKHSWAAKTETSKTATIDSIPVGYWGWFSKETLPLSRLPLDRLPMKKRVIISSSLS